jgi:hypothetical protein
MVKINLVRARQTEDSTTIKPAAWAMGYAFTNRSYIGESPAEALKRMRTAAIKAGTYIPKIENMEAGTGFTAKRKGKAAEERFLLLTNGELIDVNGDPCEISAIDVPSMHRVTLPNDKETA